MERKHFVFWTANFAKKIDKDHFSDYASEQRTGFSCLFQAVYD